MQPWYAMATVVVVRRFQTKTGGRCQTEPVVVVCVGRVWEGGLSRSVLSGILRGGQVGGVHSSPGVQRVVGEP